MATGHVDQPRKGSGYGNMGKVMKNRSVSARSGKDAYKPPHAGGMKDGKGYETHPHGGYGTRQNPGWGAGRGKNSTTPHAERVPHAGAGGNGKGYDTMAHTRAHHGRSGQARGEKGSIKPMDYDTKLQGEGHGRIKGDGPTLVNCYNHGAGNPKAHHHPPAPSEPHKFDRPPAGDAHGFGHPAHLRRGHLRFSGHKMAHMIGPQNTSMKSK